MGRIQTRESIVSKTWLKLLTKTLLDLYGGVWGRRPAAGSTVEMLPLPVFKWRSFPLLPVQKTVIFSKGCCFPLLFSFLFYNTAMTGQMLVADLTLRCGCLLIQHNWPVARCVSWPYEDFSWVAGRKLPWPGNKLKLRVKNWQHW